MTEKIITRYSINIEDSTIETLQDFLEKDRIKGATHFRFVWDKDFQLRNVIFKYFETYRFLEPKEKYTIEIEKLQFQIDKLKEKIHE